MIFRNLLQVVNGDDTKFYVGKGNKNFYPIVKLPSGITCQQCILQVCIFCNLLVKEQDCQTESTM